MEQTGHIDHFEKSARRDRSGYLAYIEQFQKIRIAVIGEGILDVFLHGTTLQLCREAPVPIIEAEGSRSSPGGAANTAVNLANLGAQVHFLSILGSDADGLFLTRLLQDNKVNTDHCLLYNDRETLFKQRITAGSQMLLRLDKGSTNAITDIHQTELTERLNEIVNECDALIVSDYNYGLLTPALIKAISEIVKKGALLTAVDAKDLLKYENFAPVFIKPNYKEAVTLLNLPYLSGEAKVEQIRTSGEKVRERFKALIAAITLDEDGALIFRKGEPPYRTHAVRQEHPNPAGAGDTFMAAFMLAISSGANPPVAAEIASGAANIAVSKKGTTASCSLEELRGSFSIQDKQILTTDALKEIAAYYRSRRLKIVFTNGCFDIIHPGHIHFLEQSRSLGDILFVAVNSDESIRRIKGNNRPINTLSDRIKILCSLNSIDHVMGFSGDSPSEIIRTLRPEVFVKGSTYKIEDLPEVPLIKEQGGEIRILPVLRDYSTLGILQKIARS